MMLKSHMRPAEPLKHDFSSLPLSLSLKKKKHKKNLYLTGSLGLRIKVLDNGGKKSNAVHRSQEVTIRDY